MRERNTRRGGCWGERRVGLEPEHPLVCLSDGQQTPLGKIQPGCSEESSWASPWGRFAAAASRCPGFHTLSCCRTGLRETEGPPTVWVSIQTQYHQGLSHAYTFSTVHHIKQNIFLKMDHKEDDSNKFSVTVTTCFVHNIGILSHKMVMTSVFCGYFYKQQTQSNIIFSLDWIVFVSSW